MNDNIPTVPGAYWGFIEEQFDGRPAKSWHLFELEDTARLKSGPFWLAPGWECELEEDTLSLVKHWVYIPKPIITIHI